MATSKGKSKNKGARKAKPSVLKQAGKAKKAGTPATEGEMPASTRRRWTKMSIPELRALYVEKVGRPTDSDDRGYLIWKIRAAEKGSIPVGPSKRTRFDGPTTPVTLKLGDEFLDKLDEAAGEDGFNTRLGYIRDLMAKGLEVRGRNGLATMVAG